MNLRISTDLSISYPLTKVRAFNGETKFFCSTTLMIDDRDTQDVRGVTPSGAVSERREKQRSETDSPRTLGKAYFLPARAPPVTRDARRGFLDRETSSSIDQGQPKACKACKRKRRNKYALI